MSRRLSRLSVLAAAAALSSPRAATSSSGPVEIRWYCCLGTGEDPAQIEVEQAVVEAFNASHPNIKLTFEPIPYASARDTLATQLASGRAPTSSVRSASVAPRRSTASGWTSSPTSTRPSTT